MTFFISLLSVLILPFNKVLAHVSYVIPEIVLVSKSGPDALFLMQVFNDPKNIWLMVGVGLITIISVLLIQRWSYFISWSIRLKERLALYDDFLPWMVRLSLGIALIGAGTSEVFISESLQSTSAVATIEIFLGFAFLLGFFLVPITLISIILFFVALSQSIYIFGNFDFLGLLLAYLALHSERPGFDDIFNIKPLYGLRLPVGFAPLMLRIGIGVSMIFLAIYEKILNPHWSEMVVIDYGLNNFVPVEPAMWVLSVGIIELIVGLCLFFGFYTRFVSIVAFFILSTSFFFFKESVTSHVTLFGLLSILFVTGGGMYSLDKLLRRPKQLVDSN
jgi:uncharacterized membrane protein YphA (DoxX/SURF4 family)